MSGWKRLSGSSESRSCPVKSIRSELSARTSSILSSMSMSLSSIGLRVSVRTVLRVSVHNSWGVSVCVSAVMVWVILVCMLCASGVVVGSLITMLMYCVLLRSSLYLRRNVLSLEVEVLSSRGVFEDSPVGVGVSVSVMVCVIVGCGF